MGQLSILPKEKNLIKISEKSLASVKDIVLLGTFVFLTALGAKIKLETGPVPFTFQTFFVLASGVFLGKGLGALSQAIYLFLGLLGIPWFAGGGGIGYVLSPTFGYLLGFVFSAWLAGWFFERGWAKNLKKKIFALVLSDLSLYPFGLLWLARFVEFKKVLKIGFFPFLLGDLFKILLLGMVFGLFQKVIGQNNE